MINFDKAILVVAHPDDEIMWFSSIVQKVADIVICFLAFDAKPLLTEGRKKALADYPLSHMSCLGLKESNIFNDDNWRNPTLSDYGLKVGGVRPRVNAYQSNYAALKHALEAKLNGYEHVLTHSPWGEYGHEEHVQVFKVVMDLKRKYKFKVWYPNYVSNKSYPLMFKNIQNFELLYVSYPTSQELAKNIKSLYEKNNCWTWYNEWQWPSCDVFINNADGDKNQPKFGRLFPLNLVEVEISEPKNAITNLIGFPIIKRFLSFFKNAERAINYIAKK